MVFGKRCRVVGGGDRKAAVCNDKFDGVELSQ